MESPKVINKVLLSSVAFGVSFGIGLLVSKADIKNALTTGALAATAGFAGTLVSDRKRADGENLVEDSRQTQVQELKTQEDRLHQSIAEATTRMQEVEAGINSLQTEHNQLLGIVSDLNSQKQQLETENQNLQAQIQELNQQHEQLAQVLAPLEEEPAESEAFEDRSNEELEELIGSVSEEQLEEPKDIDESSETSRNELTVEEAESVANDNSVGEVEEVFLEELDNLSEEEVVSLTELDLTSEDSEQLDALLDANPRDDGDRLIEELAQPEFPTAEFVPSEESIEQMEEIASQEEQISLEELDSIDEEEIASLTELELTSEDSEQLDALLDANSRDDGDRLIEELAQPEFPTAEFVPSEELMEDIEGINFEVTEQSSWAELYNFEEEDATIAFSSFEPTTEDSEELDNLLDSTTTFDSESLEHLMGETAELGILDIVGELAQPESLESKIEESVTLESLMSEAEVASLHELQEVETELANEFDDHFFSSINEATEGETTDTEQESEQLDSLISLSYTSEPSELETAHGESEFLENLIDNTEENFLENFESVEKLPETEIHESSTIDHFLSETLDLEDSFDRWEETSEEFGQLDDLSTSMSESSFQEKLEIVDEKLCELDSISEASLEEFEDLLESMEEQNISMSFSDDVDDIETTKTQNLWD